MRLSANARSIFSGRVVGLGLGRQAWAGSGLVAILCMQALAGPEGERVVNGAATFTRNGSTTVVQAANNTIIDYRSFNIGAGETVQFIQPDAAARVLNRVPDAVNPTHIDGTLRANGIVYIVNSAGVYFGNRAVVSAAGIYAAAGQITNSDFLSNVNHFTNVTGDVSNAGTISAGTAALVGKHVENLGTIHSERGIVTMAAGDDVYISEIGGTMMVQIADNGTSAGTDATPGINNAGHIDAPGGTVRLAAGDMYSLAIRMPGRITGRNVKVQAQGRGTAIVSGVIDASSSTPGERGGSVQVLGDRVGISGATIDASGPAGGGEILIGGDFQGHGDVPTASRTTVTTGSTLRADATDQGNGGKVVVWSDEITRYSGNISATGGRRGGDGGNVEVSGKHSLLFTGVVDTRASLGRDGSLLLDPDDIIIQAAAGPDDGQVGPGDGDVLFADGAGTFTIGRAAIESILGDINLQANNDITVNTSLTLSNQTFGESVSFRAGNTITVNGNITTSGASLTLTANDASGVPTGTGSIVVNGFLSTADAPGVAGDLALNIAAGTGTVTLGGDLITDGGTISINHPVIVTNTLSLDTDLTGGAGNAGDILLDPASSINVNGVASVFLRADADGGGANGNITVGTVGDTGPDHPMSFWALGNAVTLNGNITASADVVLGLTGGSVVLAAPVTVDNTLGTDNPITVNNAVGNFALTLTGDPASMLAINGADVDSLSLTGGTLQLSGTIETDTAQTYAGVGAITLSADTTLVARDSDAGNALQDISTGAANVITGAFNLAVSGAAVSLAAVGDGMNDPTLLTVTSSGDTTLGNVSAGTAAITADSDLDGAGAVTVSAGMTAGTTTGDLTITGTDLILDGSISSPAATVRIHRSVVGIIGVGDTAGDMSIDRAEFSRIAAGGLEIGGTATTNGIVVDNIQPADSAGITGLVTLNAAGNGASVVFQNMPSTFNALSVLADNGIQVNTDLTTAVGALALDADSDDAADAGDALALGAGVTIASAGDLTLDATTGGITGAGGGILHAAGDLHINNSFTTGGVLDAVADTDANGAGAVIIATGAAIDTGGSDIDLTGADLVLDGSIVAGAGTVSIARSSVGTLRLGGAAQAGDLHISTTELQSISATGLNLGGATTSVLDVDTVAAADSAGVTGVLQLIATADTGAVHFVNGPSSFNTLSVTADDGVIIDHDLSTVVGDLSLNANADNMDDTSDSVLVADGVNITAANDILAAGNSVHLTGAAATTNTFTSGTDGSITLPVVIADNDLTLVLNSEGNITLGSVALGGGTLMAHADTDADGMATLATAGVTAGTVSLSGGSDLDDIVDVNLPISGTSGISIQNAATVNIAGGADLTSMTGDIDLATGVSSVVLTGADGVSSAISAGAGGVHLAPVTAVNNPSLTISGNGDAVVSSIDINTGALTLDTNVVPGSGVNLTIDAGDVSFLRNVTTAGGATVTIANTGTLSFGSASLLTLDGAFNQTGAGPTNLAGSIVTSGDAITFNGPVILTGASLLDTGAGAGDITFHAAVRSDSDATPRNLTLNTGTGNLSAESTIGDGGLIDELLIQTVNNATFAGTVSANAVRLGLGSGTTTFQGLLLAQGASGIDLNGNAFVFQGAVVTTGSGGGFSLTNTGTADFQSTSNIALAGAFLQDGTGAVTLAAPITTSLAPISFAGPVTVPAAITISNNGAGDITFSSTLATTMPFTVDGGAAGSGNINFNGAVTATGELVARTGAGNVTFANSVTANNALTAASTTGAITFNGPLSVGGALSATSTTGGISFVSTVSAGSVFSVSSQSGGIQFGAAVNGFTAGTGVFLLNSATGDITFNSPATVGSTTAVQEFSASGRNITIQSIRTEGTAAPGDGDITLVPDLTVTPNQVPGQTQTDNRPNGVVRIAGNLLANNGNISIGAAGRSAVPSVATTILGNPAIGVGQSLPTLAIAATNGNITFGTADKLTAFGNLALSGQNVAISDVAALGSLTVNSGSLTLLQRAPAVLVLPSAGGISSTFIDSGPNIVARDGVNLSNAGTVVASGAGSPPTFASANGVGTGVPSEFPVALRPTFTADDLRAGSLVLAIDARGTVNSGLATALANAIPRYPDTEAVYEERSITSAEMGDLRELAINPREMSADELLQFLAHPGIYEDVVLDPDAQPGDYLVTVNRLPFSQVQRVLATYHGLFKETLTDPATGRPAIDPATGQVLAHDRSDAIRDELAASIARFRKEGRGGALDPVEFRRYLESNASEAAALGYIDSLQRLFDQIHLLGLGPKEESISRRRILERVCPSDLPAGQLEQVVNFRWNDLAALDF